MFNKRKAEPLPVVNVTVQIEQHMLKYRLEKVEDELRKLRETNQELIDLITDEYNGEQ